MLLIGWSRAANTYFTEGAALPPCTYMNDGVNLGAVPASAPPLGGACRDRVKILLVDDSAPIRKLMLLILEGHQGISEVREAEDGFSALEQCSESVPDLVLLDYWMPGMDGAQTALHIRERYPQTRIVAYSAALETLPSWADALFIKDAVPDPDQLVRLARGA